MRISSLKRDLHELNRVTPASVPRGSNKRRLRPAQTLIWLQLGFALALVLLVGPSFMDDPGAPGILILGLVLIACSLLMLTASSVIYDGQAVAARNWPFPYKALSWKDIVSVEEDPEDNMKLLLFTNKRQLRISTMMGGAKEFLAHAEMMATVNTHEYAGITRG